VQYVEKKFMDVNYMLVQNHVHYNMLSKKNHLMELLFLLSWVVIVLFAPLEAHNKRTKNMIILILSAPLLF